MLFKPNCREELEECKRRIERLKHSEIRLKGILSSLDDLVFVFDKEGRFTFYHTPDEKRLYRPPKKFMGKKHSEVMPTHMDKMFIEAIKKNKNGKVAEYEYRLKIAGKTRYYFAKLSPIITNNKYEGSVAVARDVTKLKEGEKRLKKRNEELRKFKTKPKPKKRKLK